jgi:hypothetical protein
MQHTAPKQCKLLGATVRGLGLVVAVSSTLTYGYTIVEGADRVNRRIAFRDLNRDEVQFPLEPQPYVTQVERVAYGTWDEVHSLVPAQPVSLAVAA